MKTEPTKQKIAKYKENTIAVTKGSCAGFENNEIPSFARCEGKVCKKKKLNERKKN